MFFQRKQTDFRFELRLLEQLVLLLFLFEKHGVSQLHALSDGAVLQFCNRVVVRLVLTGVSLLQRNSVISLNETLTVLQDNRVSEGNFLWVVEVNGEVDLGIELVVEKLDFLLHFRNLLGNFLLKDL